MFARFFRRMKGIQKVALRLPKALLLSSILFFNLLGIITPVFGQAVNYDPAPAADATYTDYFNLFSPINSTQFTQTKLTPAANGGVDGVEFLLSAKFDQNLKNLEWYWDHVVDIDDTRNAFVVRTCPIENGAMNKDKCMLSQVSSATYPTTCPNAICPEEEYTKAIYQYTPKELNVSMGDGTTSTTIVTGQYRGNFGVRIPIRQFHLLSQINGENLTGSPSTALTPGALYQSDMWYCADNSEEFPDLDEKNIPEKDRIKKFGEVCDGDEDRFYFRIGQPVNFTYPANPTQANPGTVGTGQTVQPGDNLTDENPNGSKLPQCGLIDGTVIGCVAKVVYYLIYKPIEWITGLLGNLFDFFLGYSISDESYRLDFAVRGWKLIRDISNIFFIVILVWTGFAAVFDIGGVSMKKVVPNLILNALLINFSLFATRVVIDVSNIFARLLYNTMNVYKVDTATGERVLNNDGPGGYKPLSEKIVSAFNPQKLFQTKFISPENALGNGDESDTNSVQSDFNTQSSGQSFQNSSGFSRSSQEYAGYFIIVSILSSIILFSVAKMFWKVAFFFVGRVVGLYIAMIFSPFAFLTRKGMPLTGGIPQLSWSNWVKDLTNYALLAPIFCLFLYLIYLFVNSPFIQIFKSESRSFFETVIDVSVPLLIVFYLISYGVDLAKKYSGTIGNMVQQGMNTAAGIVGGAALGATALVGARALGGAAKALDESGVGRRVRDMAAKGGLTGRTGRLLQRGLNSGRSGSYDARQTTIGRTFLGGLGVNANPAALNALAGVGLGLSTEQRQGGIEADIARRQKKMEDRAKLFEEKMTDDQVKEYNDRRKAEYERKIDKIVEAKMAQTHSKADVEDWKKNDKAKYDAERTIAMQDADVKTKVSSIPEAKKMQTAAEVNSARREDFTKSLKQRSLLDMTLGQVPIVNAVIGTGVRTEGDKKAAKKMEDKNKEKDKIDEDLKKIDKILSKGFQDLIALEEYQNTPEFVKLNAKEKAEVIRGERSMYDLLTEDEKKAVDAKQKNFTKDQYDEHYERVKVREQEKYNTEEIKKDFNKKKKAYAANPAGTKEKQEFMDALIEIQKAQKHQKIWRDVDKYKEDQKKKLKGGDEENKK